MHKARLPCPCSSSLAFCIELQALLPNAILFFTCQLDVLLFYSWGAQWTWLSAPMFSKGNHPYIQLDDSYLESSNNPDYDTSKQTDHAIQLQDLSRSKSLQRHPYRALETPTANLETPSSPLKSPSSGRSRAPSDVSKPLPQVPISRWSGWRFSVASGCGATIFVLICNIALAGWSSGKPKSNTNNLLLYTGDCAEMKRIDTLSHLAINVLSTILLGASNYSMQVLVAPTRENIDAAHPQGRYAFFF